MRRPSRPQDRSARLVVAAAAAVAAALVPFARLPELGDPLFTFAAFIGLIELVDTALPSGRRLSLTLAPALAFAMLETADASASSAAVVGLTFAAATGAAATIRRIAGRQIRPAETATSFLVVVAAAGAYDAVATGSTWNLLSRGGMPLASVAGTMVVLAIALVAEPLRLRYAPPPGEGAPAFARRWFLPELRRTAPLQAAIVSVAALAAIAFPTLGGWSFPLFLGPLAATRYAFRQIAAIRTTEVQTLRALSKIPEMAGYTHPGHSRRVAGLAVAMAAEMGAPEDELRDIEYAALLHDIGRVVLEDPEQADAAVLRGQIASTGSNIVAAAGTFPRVARMIREQHEPYRRPGEIANDDLGLGARILKVANTYDDLLHGASSRHSPLEALESLHLGKAYDYDPAVVGALAKVLERAGTI